MINMQSSEKEKETRKNGTPEMRYSHLKLNDRHLTFRPNEGTQYMSENTIHLAPQSSGNSQSTFGGLNPPQIKKEFPDESAHGIKTRDRCNTLTIKQESNIKLEPGIKMEPQEFNNTQQVEGRIVIDLTEDDDNSSAQKRPMPRAELWTVINKRQKTAMTPIEIFDHPVESLFVQDDDSPRSISANTSDPLLELGEDHVSG